MTFLEKLNTIERLHYLIKLKATGNPNTLARKFGVSRRAIFHTIDLLRQMGASVEYCMYKQSYYYKTNCELMLGYIEGKETKA